MEIIPKAKFGLYIYPSVKPTGNLIYIYNDKTYCVAIDIKTERPLLYLFLKISWRRGEVPKKL